MPPSLAPHDTKVPPFLLKVVEMLETRTLDEHIAWSADGKDLVIADTEVFSRVVLPAYFKATQYMSFVRQLHMYGWKKQTHSHASGDGAGSAGAGAGGAGSDEGEGEDRAPPALSGAASHATSTSGHVGCHSLCEVFRNSEIHRGVTLDELRNFYTALVRRKRGEAHVEVASTTAASDAPEPGAGTAGAEAAEEAWDDHQHRESEAHRALLKRRASSRSAGVADHVSPAALHTGAGAGAGAVAGVGAVAGSPGLGLPGEIKEFNKRQQVMLSSIVALEGYTSKLTHDTAQLSGEVARLFEAQSAVHLVLQAAAAEGVEAAFSLVKGN
jgi:hypothetical protein